MSRFGTSGRHVSMDPRTSRIRLWLTAVVLAHLVISLAHGRAHGQARVPLSVAANLFVFLVILAGPLLGLVLIRYAQRAGAWLVASTLTASFVFGVVNHFLIAGADHVAYVDPHARALFAATAVLLAASEGIGAALAVRLCGKRNLS